VSTRQSKPRTLGLLAFVVLFLGGGATYFQYQAVQAVKGEVAALESQVPSQKDLERSLSESNAKLTEYQAKLVHLEASVPDVAYIPTLMKELETMGKSHGIKVTGVRPAPQQFMQPAGPMQEGKKQKKKEYEEIEIEVKGRGRYDHIKALLDSLQEFPKILAVKTVSMAPMRESGSGSAGEIEATINVVAYVFPFEMVTGADQAQATGQGGTEGAQSSVATDGSASAQPAAPNNTSSTHVTGTQKVARSGGRK
jgi:Tfp pilus assembly protein PilO